MRKSFVFQEFSTTPVSRTRAFERFAFFFHQRFPDFSIRFVVAKIGSGRPAVVAFEDGRPPSRRRHSQIPIYKNIQMSNLLIRCTRLSCCDYRVASRRATPALYTPLVCILRVLRVFLLSPPPSLFFFSFSNRALCMPVYVSARVTVCLSLSLSI